MSTTILSRLDDLTAQAIEQVSKYTGISQQQATFGVGAVGAGLGALALWKAFGSSKYNLPPGPTPLPFVGNIFNMGSNPMPYLTFDDLAQKYGDVAMLSLGPYPTILLSSADAIREANIRDGINFADRPLFASIDVFSNGGKDILGAPYCPRVQIQRKLAFSALRKYASGSALEEHVNAAFEALCKDVDEKGFFVPIPMGFLVAYNILASMSFGRKFEFDDPFLTKMRNIQAELEKSFTGASFFFLLPFMKHFPSAVMRVMRQLTAAMSELLDECLADHLKTYKEDQLTDFTYHMIHAWREAEQDPNEKNKVKSLDKEHFKFILMDLFLAGTETTRATLAWIWLYLAAFPEVQQKAQQEVDDVLGNYLVAGHEGKVTVNCRDQLPYVDAVVHEVMRIMPVAPTGVPRRTLEDTKLKGYDIPKGAYVFNNTWSAHHDESMWEDPYAFKPERWLDENGQYVFQQNGFLPFGVGRRSCIGESFAKLEIHMITTMILQRYNLKPAPGRRIDLTLMEVGVVRAQDQDIYAERRW